MPLRRSCAQMVRSFFASQSPLNLYITHSFAFFVMGDSGHVLALGGLIPPLQSAERPSLIDVHFPYTFAFAFAH